MKKTLFAVSLLVISFISWNAQTSSIEWQKNFKKAQIEARQSGKPLLLDFTATWCKPCLMMDRDFWSRTDVAKAVSPFIAVKIDYDSEKGLVDRYRVGAIPFVAFTDPLGNMVTFRKGFGGKNVRELNQIFEEMPKDFSELIPMYEAIERNKNDGFAHVKIADSYRASHMTRLSCLFYEKALKSEALEKDQIEKERVAATLGVNYFSIKDYRNAVESLSDYVKWFPGGKNRETVLLAMSLANSYLDKPKDALKFLEILKSEFPSSKSIASAEKGIEDAKIRKETKK